MSRMYIFSLPVNILMRFDFLLHCLVVLLQGPPLSCDGSHIETHYRNIFLPQTLNPVILVILEGRLSHNRGATTHSDNILTGACFTITLVASLACTCVGARGVSTGSLDGTVVGGSRRTLVDILRQKKDLIYYHGMSYYTAIPRSWPSN